MPRVGFETTIPLFQRAKTAHALDRAGNVIGDVVEVTVYKYFQGMNGVRRVSFLDFPVTQPRSSNLFFAGVMKMTKCTCLFWK
jgi:hypothetical protein